MVERRSLNPTKGKQTMTNIYTVVSAQDVPHYGSVEIEAENDTDALTRAKTYWQEAHHGEKPWPLDDAQYDSAVLARIVSISDSADREVACDVRLDTYVLQFAPDELDAKIFEHAKPMFAALQSIAAYDTDALDTNDAEHDALLEIVETAQTVLAALIHDPPYQQQQGWHLVDFDNTGLLHIEKDDAAPVFESDANAVAYAHICWPQAILSLLLLGIFPTLEYQRR
jgi:hypothetical protein